MKTLYAFSIAISLIFSQKLAGDLAQLAEAKSLYAQQKQEESFEMYLKCVESKQSHPTETSVEEKALYQEALKLYLDAKGGKFFEGCSEIISRYAKITEQQPHYGELALVVAAAYANLGQILKFYDTFSQAYLLHPDHYLAHKTLAILSIKQFERVPPGEAKEQYRKQLLVHLDKAIKKFPADISLFRLSIVYSSENQRSGRVRESLNQIMSRELVIPRIELEFFVQHALTLKDLEFIQCFIDKASEWYHFSRILDEAKQQLEYQREHKVYHD